MHKQKRLILFYLFWPIILTAEPKVLVDAVPTDASFAGVTPLKMPFTDADRLDPKKIEVGLNQAIAGILPSAAQQGFSYICLLSAPGDQPVEIKIHAANANLGLSRKGTSVAVVFYRGGHDPTGTPSYSTDNPEGKAPRVSTEFQKVAVPPGGSTAGWVYLNLTRVQAEAEKAKSQAIFISAAGSGPMVPVAIPGMKNPLLVPDEKSKFTASWYMSPEMAATHRGEVLGHPVPESGPKKESTHSP